MPLTCSGGQPLGDPHPNSSIPDPCSFPFVLLPFGSQVNASLGLSVSCIIAMLEIVLQNQSCALHRAGIASK